MRRGRIPELGLLLLGYQLLQNIGLTNIPPVTLASIIIQVSIYLNVVNVPRMCISGASVAQDKDWMRLLVPAIRHTHDIHLYYNMVSLAWKGLELERRLGSVKYLITLFLLTLMSSSFYVILAFIGAEVLEDVSLLHQCAIGFSGVLFAMKVVNIHYSNQEEQPTSFFGFLVPMKYAVWLELAIIQIMVPNSSFMGHLAGILAGLLFVKGPVSSILSLDHPPSYQRRVPPSRSFLSSILPVNLFTIILCAAQAGLFLGVIPNLRPFKGCIQLSYFNQQSININSMKTMLLSPFHHQSIIHLSINLLSFYMKGRTLEPKLGVVKYVKTVILSVIGTCVMHVLLMSLAPHVYPELLSHTCVAGLSATLFCLKVILLRHASSLNFSLLFELGEMIMLVEKNTRLYHISGLLTGLVLLMWFSDTCTNTPWTRVGNILGGGSAQPAWTRSWGYAGFHDDENDEMYQEALRRSRQTYENEQFFDRSFTPTAPPAEDQVPDLVGVRPPLYAQGPAPPPPGQAYQMSDDDDLRRRRLQRFS